MVRTLAAATALIVIVLGTADAGAQETAPPEPGVEVHIPIVDEIVIDGELSDWSRVEAITTSTGPQLSPDPANTSSLTWQVAATSRSLVFNAVVVDATIIAGQHGDDYWNEDSVELYVNFTDDRSTTMYAPGIAQITVSPIDIGNTDPNALTITGNNAADSGASGFVFSTADGWGLEIEVPLPTSIVPSAGDTIGLQVHANGSSGGDRDTKLIWSLADVSDRSFTDPSVFGSGRFVQLESLSAQDVPEESGESSNDSLVLDDSLDGNDPFVEDAAEPEIVEAPVAAPVDPPAEEPTGNRTVLVASVLGAVAVLAAGVGFEHRRKVAEVKAAEAEGDANESDPLELESGVS